jgi:hypothetical protein
MSDFKITKEDVWLDTTLRGWRMENKGWIIDN